MNSAELNSRADVYARIATQNELDEDDYIYSKIKAIWTQIIPLTGSNKVLSGGMSYPEVKHKFIIRVAALPNIENDMYFVFKNQRYNIDYFIPNYKSRDLVEVFCTLREDGKNVKCSF